MFFFLSTFTTPTINAKLFCESTRKKMKIIEKNIHDNEANFEIINKQIKLRLILSRLFKNHFLNYYQSINECNRFKVVNHIFFAHIWIGFQVLNSTMENNFTNYLDVNRQY